MAAAQFKRFVVLVALAFMGNSLDAAQLVLNGGFETGDFSNWTLSGNTASTGVDSLAPHSGRFSAFLGPQGSLGFLDQILPTLGGATYELSYFLQSDGGTLNEFRVQVNSNILFDQINIPLQPFTPFVFDFVATGTSTDLKFGFRDDPGFLRLDDIAVNTLATAVPDCSPLALVASALLLAAIFARPQWRTNSSLTVAATSGKTG